MSRLTDPPSPETVTSVVLGTPSEPVLMRGCTWAAPWWVFGHNDWYVLRVPGGCVLVDPDGDVVSHTTGAAPDTGDTGGSGSIGESRQYTTSIWEPLGHALAIMLTTDQHERSAYALRERFDIPVWAPDAGLPANGGELEGLPDQTYRAGTELPGGLRAIALASSGVPDPTAPHALAWCAPDGERVLFTGDALNGPADPRHPLHASLDRLVPALYAGASRDHLLSVGPHALRTALAPLLAEQADLICGGHGAPVASAHALLQRLLALDWHAELTAGNDVYAHADQ